MATPAAVDAILAQAKGTLSKANDYSKTLPKEPVLPEAPVKNEYSNAPYKMAAKKPLTGLKKEAADTGASIKWNMQQADALKK